MAQIPLEEPGDGAEKPLPTPEEVARLFGDDKREIYETAGEGRRRGLLKLWENERRNPVPAPVTEPDARTRAAYRELQALSRSYVKTPEGDVPLRVRKIRYRAELQDPAKDPLRKAQRALQCHMLDMFIEKDSIDYNQILQAASADPLCAPLDEQLVKMLYLRFIEVLLHDQQITEEIFEDDDDL